MIILNVSINADFFEKKVFSTNFDFDKKCKNEIVPKNEKYLVDSATQFPANSIFRPMISTKTKRQRKS